MIIRWCPKTSYWTLIECKVYDAFQQEDLGQEDLKWLQEERLRWRSSGDHPLGHHLYHHLHGHHLYHHININNKVITLKVTREGGSRKVVPPRWYFRSISQEIFILRSSISISKGMKMRKGRQRTKELLLQLNIALHFFPGHPPPPHHHHPHHHHHDHNQCYHRIFNP